MLLQDPPEPWLFEDDTCVAFLDRSPVFLGHTLVIPRVHIPTLDALPATLALPFFLAVQRIERAVREATEAEGSFVAINNVVSQSVPHLHVHVVPRHRGDGLRGFFWPRRRYRDEEERAQYAGRIRSAIARAR